VIVPCWLALLPALGVPIASAAEGSYQVHGTLQSDTVIYIDIIDVGDEAFWWTGSGDAYVFYPDGTPLAGGGPAGPTIFPSEAGTWRF